MLTEFINKKLLSAKYKILPDGSHFAMIPSAKGVWANAKNINDCKNELREVLEDWLFLKVRDREHIPGFNFKIDKRSLVKS